MKENKLIISGVSLVAAGFIVLFFVNRNATNIAGFISPLLLVSGWVVIAIGLWKKDE
ncbi:MAG: hypothetical protein PF545_01275 [Elusimicrobia bacterium]|jgi:hypothetical protein|nr:hypothetical protein [Elusimicrobiota bacterium]